MRAAGPTTWAARMVPEQQDTVRANGMDSSVVVYTSRGFRFKSNPSTKPCWLKLSGFVHEDVILIKSWKIMKPNLTLEEIEPGSKMAAL